MSLIKKVSSNYRLVVPLMNGKKVNIPLESIGCVVRFAYYENEEDAIEYPIHINYQEEDCFVSFLNERGEGKPKVLPQECVSLEVYDSLVELFLGDDVSTKKVGSEVFLCVVVPNECGMAYHGINLRHTSIFLKENGDVSVIQGITSVTELHFTEMEGDRKNYVYQLSNSGMSTLKTLLGLND